MIHVNIELGRCVKVSSKNALCSNCADICPENAISFLDNIPQVSTSCTECSLCLGSCPADAIKLKGFDTLETIFGLLEQKKSTVACGHDIPCIGVYHVEHLISIAMLGNTNILELHHCETCAEALHMRVQEANLFLASIQSPKKITLAPVKPIEVNDDNIDSTQSRRAFLERLSLKGAIKSKAEFEKEIEALEPRTLSTADSINIRKKEIPNRRKLFFMALKRLEKSTNFVEIPYGELSFISQKSIDESCDNCSMCYRICPTEALSSDRRGTKIDFDPLSCIKCHLCHDVCQSNSIHLEAFDTENIFEPKVQELVTFDVIRCEECANYFTYFGGETLCPRCKIEEEEAKSLWGIQ